MKRSSSGIVDTGDLNQVWIFGIYNFAAPISEASILIFMKKTGIGPLGENISCRYLQERGFEVVERNYNKKQGEIDIVAKKGRSLHFIEVKSVSWNFGAGEVEERGIRPEENMHANKLKRVFRAVQIYLMEQHVPSDTLWQIDAIFVFIDDKQKKSAVEYYEHIGLE